MQGIIMKIKYVAIVSFSILIQIPQFYASSSRSPFDPEARIAQQEAKKMGAITQQIAACSIYKPSQSLQSVRDLRITTDFTESESDILDQICKEPNVRENKLPQSTSIDQAWQDLVRPEHAIIEHGDVFSPPLKVGTHNNKLKELFIVTDFKDETL
jgi:hypothetical protein